MSTEVRWRKGTTAETATFTGALAEITVDTNKNVVVVHDGVTAGGFPSESSASVNQKLINYALKASPVFTGNPTAPTPVVGDNSGSIATTKFVKDQGYAPTVSPTFTGIPLAPTAAPKTNTTQIATVAYVENAFSTLTNVRVRQAIQYGPVTGTPAVSNLIPQSQINNTLATGVTVKFSTAPTFLSIANGFNADGSDSNVNVVLNADLTLANLTASTTNLIVYDKTNSVLVKSIVLDTDTKGGTPGVTNGLYTLDYENWKMYLGNGTTAVPVQHIILAEVDTDGTKVVAIRCRAYLRKWVAGYINILPAVLVSKNHNMGTDRILGFIRAKCLTADAGFAVGQVIQLATINSAYASPSQPAYDRNIIKIAPQTGGASNWVATNFATQNIAGLSNANWAYELFVVSDF